MTRSGNGVCGTMGISRKFLKMSAGTWVALLVHSLLSNEHYGRRHTLGTLDSQQGASGANQSFLRTKDLVNGLQQNKQQSWSGTHDEGDRLSKRYLGVFKGFVC